MIARRVFFVAMIPLLIAAATFAARPSGYKKLKQPDDATGSANVVLGERKAPASVGAPVPVPPQFNGTIHSPEDYEGLALPFRNDLYDLTTVYLSATGNDYLDLFAGALQRDPTTGVLVVRDENAGGGTPSLPSGAFTLPGAGYLSMTAVAGFIVNMTDQGGVPHVFDLASDRFAP
ncbi:MAG: hypothetical protein ACYDCC_13440 [Actinomycetota bacterium]